MRGGHQRKNSRKSYADAGFLILCKNGGGELPPPPNYLKSSSRDEEVVTLFILLRWHARRIKEAAEFGQNALRRCTIRSNKGSPNMYNIHIFVYKRIIYIYMYNVHVHILHFYSLTCSRQINLGLTVTRADSHLPPTLHKLDAQPFFLSMPTS